MSSDLFAEAIAGDRRALARLLSLLVDSAAPDLVKRVEALPHPEHVIGITGPPGAGKSSLVDRLIIRYRADAARPGIVLVDPSSPFTGGAILGDRVRMQAHSADPDVFIRSLATRGRLGGLAVGADLAVKVLGAAGYTPLIIEPVGVGQSELDVVNLADTVVVVLYPEWGDEVQAAKAGLIEIGNVFCINKSDLADPGRSVTYLEQALALGARSSWIPPVVAASALSGLGIEDLITAIDAHRRHRVRQETPATRGSNVPELGG
ncbi:MAG: methylmalonyl Co-A mutase-associated GTPase MeaB [Actinomycetota bacterium]